MPKKVFQVKILAQPGDLPKPHELRAATILANEFFNQDVVFLRRTHGKTPDLDVAGVIWEIKSPKGSSKNTIANNLKAASKQSKRIVIDLFRCKLRQDVALRRIKGYLKEGNHHLKGLIIITKSGKCLDFFSEIR